MPLYGKPAPVEEPTVDEPPAHAHARGELKKWGLNAKTIVRVDPDCVFFISDTERPMTAWARRKKNGTIVYIGELGFSAEPSEYLDDVLDD